MIYGSVCSGIEAATVAWHPLGWTPAFFSEIEKFPSAVLAQHHPHVPNLGDMTKFEEWPDHAIDLLVGGTPCQDYSVAGHRLGMAGERGQLTLTYVEIAARYRPDWIVWENVPGVLSSNDGRDFARFLGELSGQIVEVPPGGWKNSGIVSGIPDAYGLAYVVRDAQYIRTCGHPYAVPQRRRRVFVVGYIGDWRRAAAVLFDTESLCGNPPPRREAGEATTHDVAPSVVSSGRGFERAGETRGQDPVVADQIARCVTAGYGRIDAETENFVAHTLRAEGFDASEDGTGRGTPIVPIAFDCKGTEVHCQEDGGHPTLRSMGHLSSHQNAGGHAAVAFDLNRITSRTNRSNPDPSVLHTLPASPCPPHLASNWAVRRLTPRECERLQGFPDDYTMIPWRGKASEACPDGLRYKALGNSMAVNVMRWIGDRIEIVDALIKRECTA